MYATKIAEAQRGAFDVRALAEAWAALHPDAFAANKSARTLEPGAAAPTQLASKAIPPALAAFLAAAARALRAALRAVLGDLWTEGWVLGQLAAEAAVKAATAAASGSVAVDWRGWTPADVDAARQIAGDGLQNLLNSADITIQSIAESRVGELADVLEAALASDVREIEPYDKPAGVWSMQADLPARNSISDLTAKLEQVLDNPKSARNVAHTEMARAQTAATLESYGQTGVREKSWLTAPDPCPVCEANSDQGDIPLDQPFDSGDMGPPAHPGGCRCALMPSVAS